MGQLTARERQRRHQAVQGERARWWLRDGPTAVPPVAAPAQRAVGAITLAASIVGAALIVIGLWAGVFHLGDLLGP